jgi:hypothetical protein
MMPESSEAGAPQKLQQTLCHNQKCLQRNACKSYNDGVQNLELSLQIFHQLAVPEMLQGCFQKIGICPCKSSFSWLFQNRCRQVSQTVCSCRMLLEMILRGCFWKIGNSSLQNYTSDGCSRTD